MSLDNQLRKPTLDQDAYFYVDSKNLESNISYIKKNKIKNIYLREGLDGYNLTNLDFLNEILFIEKLAVAPYPKIKEVKIIASLVNLTELQYGLSDKLAIDFSSLKNISHLSFGYSSNIKGLDRLENLKTVHVNGADDTFLNQLIFKHYKKLNKLTIANSTIKGSLAFLKENISLEYLELNLIKKEFDLDGIQYLSKCLKKLKLISSKKINNINRVGELVNLEWLILSNSVTLEDCSIIKNLKKLEALTMFGSSSFINGDLRNIKKLRDTIKNYRVDNKKHYFYD